MAEIRRLADEHFKKRAEDDEDIKGLESKMATLKEVRQLWQ